MVVTLVVVVEPVVDVVVKVVVVVVVEVVVVDVVVVEGPFMRLRIQKMLDLKFYTGYEIMFQ